MTNDAQFVARSQQALLVFADSALIDCSRRRWPVAFGRLFQTTKLTGLIREGTDIHVFGATPALATQSNVTQHAHRGTSFGERLEHAVAELAALGYAKIVIVGSDCPTLAARDIRSAFALLQRKRLVLGPDHRGGCYLIGLDAQDLALLEGVRWRRNTDCAELRRRGGAAATALLAVKQDLDTLDDLRLLARSTSIWSALADELLSLLCATREGAEQIELHYEDTPQPQLWQRPPPAVPCFP